MTGPARRKTWLHAALLAPAAAFFLAFWLLPMVRLVEVGASGPKGIGAYWLVVTNENYFRSLLSTLGLSALVTAATLVISCVAGLFLERHDFLGRGLLVAVLTFPLAFPGVVVGFLIILFVRAPGRAGRRHPMAHRQKSWCWPTPSPDCSWAICISRFRG